MKQWRAYVIGYNKTWADKNQALCRKLIESADFCIDEPKGITVGQRYDTVTLEKGKDGKEVPSCMVCVGLRYNGKLVILEAYDPNKAAS